MVSPLRVWRCTASMGVVYGAVAVSMGVVSGADAVSMGVVSGADCQYGCACLTPIVAAAKLDIMDV